MRLLILIVAYNHEQKIEGVLRRIPADLGNFETEVLILDDSSSDRTFEKSSAFAANEAFPFKITVLYNPVNQGYGGNQKIGYHYAIENGFDIVALIHGDGQYAPECLPDLLTPLKDGTAEAVFGSRMLERGNALKGGMPLYKYVGNKILTFYQNLILGEHLSEFHSGYRLYSVGALAKVPFELNTNDFHFDTEIIIQFFRAGHRIRELPIPTYYGDEICNVDGLRYAWDVFKATSLAGLQDFGIFSDLKYDVRPKIENTSNYEAKLNFESSHSHAIDAVPEKARVLDIGSAGNYIGEALNGKNCRVVAIDREASDIDGVEAFHQVDLNTDPIPVDLGDFDTVLMLDVIEHLADPEAFVDALYERAGKAPDVEFVVSTGNIAFFVMRLMLLIGQFNYGNRGILDRTHTRLFTFASIRKLFEQRGFEVTHCSGIPAPYPLALGDNALGHALVRINALLIRFSKGLFSYQIFLRLRAKPSLPWLLERAHDRTESHDDR
ncbi:MAG: glycosyltransferase [Rhodospirillales bacterium]